MKEFKIKKKSNTNLIRVSGGEKREKVLEEIFEEKHDNSELIKVMDTQMEKS